MKRTTRGQLRDREGAWAGRLWEACQTMNNKLIRGRLSRMRWHNTPKSCHYAQEVNETFGQGRFSFLPGEASRECSTGGTNSSNTPTPKALLLETVGRPRARRRNLLKLGINKDVVHQASRSRKGYWRMGQMRLVRHAMTNDWLEEQGLLSLEKQWCSIRYPEGPKNLKGSK